MRWSWIDELLSCVPGESAEAIKIFGDQEFFFPDHSPGDPKVPGVILIEMIAQTAGMCIRAARDQATTILARVISARFLAAVRPNSECRVVVHVSKLGKESASVTGTILVEGRRTAEAELWIALVEGGKGYPAMDAILERWRLRQAQGIA
jgi:3-hydroxyacyl-[acyl-carrier-protein] dehydratase